MNAVDLDEEFLDVTVFMTFEWIDPNLAWVVKEKELNDKNSDDFETSSSLVSGSNLEQKNPEGE